MRGILFYLAFFCLVSVKGYYVPGTYPQEYKINDTIQVQVSSVSSFDTELPYDYYALPFCKPVEGVKKVPFSANPGSLLEGNRLKNSPYNFSIKVGEVGKVVCSPSPYYGPLTAREVKDLKSKIDNHYRVNLVLDNLPVTMYDLLDKESEFLRPGYDIGFKRGNKYYINNHLTFNVLVYRTNGEYTAAKERFSSNIFLSNLDARRRRLSAVDPASDGVAVSTAEWSTSAPFSRRHLLTAAKPAPANGSKDEGSADTNATSYYMIVGFEVSPCSIKLTAPSKAGGVLEEAVCSQDDDVSDMQEIKTNEKIVYTYSVYWQDSNIKWASRWDAYLRMPGGKVHILSILNSLLVVVLMATAVAVILLRTLRRDLARYEQVLSDGGNVDPKDEAGWKLVAGDVFRSPMNSAGLAVQVGTGVQVISTCVVSLFLAALGFLSPASRGALLTATIVLYVFLAALAGFCAVFTWGLMERSYNHWYRVAGQTSVFFSGVIMSNFTVVNLLIHKTGSTGAVPLGTYFFFVAMWFLVSIPLTFLGGVLALRVPIPKWPIKTNQIPRHIPPAPLSSKPALLFLIAGLLPFATAFVELYFAMTSLWLGYFYYLFGFVFLVMLLSAIVVAEVSILCTYAQLCSEDYTWWWSSFWRGGSVALYLLVFAITFLVSTLSNVQGFLSIVIYLSHMAVLIMGVYFAMGAIGFASSLLFVYHIFAAVKHE